MARLVTVLSLPWIGRGQRDGEEKEEKDAGTERDNLGGRWSVAPFGTSRVIICIIARCIPIPRQNARAKRRMCEADIQEISKTFTERSCPRKARNLGGGISQRYERESPRTRYTNMETKEKRNDYKEYHVAIDSPAGVDACPIPFLNPLTKLRNGSSNHPSAPDGVSVLARVRGLVSDSSSSGSRCRFFAPPNRVAASTAVASVEAIDTGGQFSDFSERLGLISGALVVIP
jgi:hypothetical protein